MQEIFVRNRLFAKTAAQRMAGFLATGALIGPYLADQLQMPFALADVGEPTTVMLSQHSLTAATNIEQLTGRRYIIGVLRRNPNLVTIS